MVKFIP